jgi:hypothetical protein
MTYVYRAFRRSWQWLWQPRGGIRDRVDSPALKRGHDPSDDTAKARARFWDGVRAGRREAEARCAKQNQQADAQKGTP